MPVRHRAVDRGLVRGRRLLVDVLGDLEDARLDRGLSYAALGRALGLSGVQVARSLRGEVDDTGLVRLSAIASAVGLDLAARTFPGGHPVRDAAQLALLERLRRVVHPSCRWRTEVLVTPAGGTGGPDHRAWDAAIDGAGWTVRVEAETRASDVQAVQRRIAVKQRDSGVEVVILLLSDTRHHRAWLRAAGPGLTAQFPTSARRALRAFARGERPAANAVLLL